MWRDVLGLGADVALIALSTEYAGWLAEHKQLEPDWTWVEVAAGTALCLAHSAAAGALAGGNWQQQQWRVVRSFGLGCMPVVLGEIKQRRLRQDERRRYQRLRA